MDLNKKAIEEFKEIYYQEFGEKLSDETARRVGEGLLELFSVIYPPELFQNIKSRPGNHKSKSRDRA